MKPLAITLLFFMMSTHCLAVTKQNKDSELNRLIQVANQFTGFSGSVLIGNSKEVLYYERIGYADQQSTEPLTDKHLFTPGSITKEFSTLAIMKLVNEGKLTYQDKVGSYLPTLPKWVQEITIEQVMTHTSGLPKINWFVGIESADVDQQIKTIKKLAFKPGKGFLYTNVNIVMRVYLVEAITKMRYQDYVKQEILNKANMHDTIQPIGMHQLNSQMVYHEDPNALKGIALYTTPLDLYKFERALWQEKIITKNQIRNTLAGDVLSGSSNRAYFDFGRFYPNKDGKLIYWEHDGSSHPTHHALKFHHFEKDLIIVLMSNDGNKNTLFDLKRSLLGALETGKAVMPISWWFKKEHTDKGFDVTFIELQKLIQQNAGFDFSEPELNNLGYWLLQKQKSSQAERIFKLNLERFPVSANAHDSYGEALIRVKKYNQAKKVLIAGLELARKEGNSGLTKSLNRQYKQLLQTVN